MKTIRQFISQPQSFARKSFVQKGRRTLLFVAGATAMVVTQASMAAEEMNHEHHNMEMDHQEHATHAGHGPHGSHIHHQHSKGGFMFELRYMHMDMEGLLDGTDSVDTRDISGAQMSATGPMKDPRFPYMMAPTEMTMDMVMAMAMYGFTDRLTGMVMLNYLSNEMDMVMHMYMSTGMPMGDMTGSMDTSGIGDTRVGAMYNINKKFMGSLALSLPTGSIDEKTDMIMTGTNIVNGNPMRTENLGMQAPYGMQLGSGTYDLIPSVTYKDEMGNSGWGSQFEYTYRIGENDNKYTLGDKAELTAWYVHKVGGFVHLSGRLDYLNWQGIEGQDPNLNPMMAPTSDPDATGGQRLDLLLGLTGVFGGHRIGLEVGKPIYQDLNGPQMETDLVYSLGYQFMMM
ncbi:MAG: alpha amylase [Gammaproteobacteria bacterium]|nr:alpha amylase [Gammaproteobacteria bacterium]